MLTAELCHAGLIQSDSNHPCLSCHRRHLSALVAQGSRFLILHFGVSHTQITHRRSQTPGKRTQGVIFSKCPWLCNSINSPLCLPATRMPFICEGQSARGKVLPLWSHPCKLPHWHLTMTPAN